MMRHVNGQLLLVCCIAVTAFAAHDSILRFLNHQQVMQMAQEAEQKQYDVKVETGDYQGDQQMEKFRAQSIVCPNGEQQCPDSSTCCPMQNGQYGCCNVVNAVCCKDGVHCCPQGYQCNEQQGRCTSQALGISFDWDDRMRRAQPLARVSANITCPDNKTKCQQNDTCCHAGKGFGCCPIHQAVCCSDQRHCCPKGTKCDIKRQRCYREDSDWEEPWIERRQGKSHSDRERRPATSTSVSKKQAVICKDGQMCPDGNTCCLLTNGSYGCCPYSDAVCCSDMVHCCPQGCQCDIVRKSCVGCRRHVYKWSNITQPPLGVVLKKEPETNAYAQDPVVCPGGQYQCPSGTTCCKLPTDQWGCCPHVKAVCCSDHIHCCPEGDTCNLSAGTCTKSAQALSVKVPAMPRVTVTAVKCPDGSQCPSGSTCCMTAGGRYGCCPYPKAVCCSDKVHCCPSGYTCDLPAQSCDKNGITIPWMRKLPAKPREIATAVKCPDGSQCPSGRTCCMTAGGKYGCCPYPKAVCCSDKVHCCPGGYTCDLPAQSCDKNGITIPWMEKSSAKPSVQSVVCPDGQSECPDGNTCCKLKSGRYGCCPLPDAVCCSDKVHCCPGGYTCDLPAQSCDKNGITIPWMEKSSAKPSVQSVVCPDGQSECPDGNTCCKLKSGRYGCCPLPDAECCSDGAHCCPTGYTCDIARQTCKKGDLIVPWEKKQPAVSRRVEAVICPDQSKCPDGHTCCEMSSGQYGCCPMPQAVCCADHVHCCPHGFTCDTATKNCKAQTGDVSVPWSIKLPAKSRVEAVVCPDGQSECPDGNTCCKMSSGQYGCCPMPQAVCCSDHLHCCPHGYTCDAGTQQCKRGDVAMPWEIKLPAKSRVEAVVCPDGQSECPDGNTCCKMSSGQYGCCPMPQAVCCSDHVHCCPNGYTCDAGTKQCKRGDVAMPWEIKLPAKSRVEAVVCPDGQSECPDGNTCCKMSSGQYGCCPMPQAVCCSDHVHCCPNGYTCDAGTKQCKRGDVAMPWEIKLPAKSRVEAVVCPDGQSECPDGNTCCKMSSGQYGCCPMPQAVCCSDHLHCCPHGYTCDAGTNQCKRGDVAMPWEIKLPAKSRVEAVVCPDGQSECPDGNTCCKMSSGQYGCCPMPQAVCCSDHVHCCPNGYTCDAGTKQCKRGDVAMPWEIKLPAKSRAEAVVCPDGQSECPDNNTCCKMSSGQYGCCPRPQAVCCSDHLHCCPHGYTCDAGTDQCKRGDVAMPWEIKLPAKSRVEAVVCPDGQSECPDGNTCCKMSSGQYGCCPMPQAVCCSDHLHCCPHGYFCDTGTKQCKRGDVAMPWEIKLPAKSRVEAVVCPDGQSECPDGNTCCKMSSGQYGCCPMPQAVCCSDHLHCCPHGYTCDAGTDQCKRGDVAMPWEIKLPAKSRVEAVVCPDGQSECPDGNTCCKMSSGQYGCCPMPQAVCCSDHVHCCPHGYTCDAGTKQCKRGDVAMPWEIKLPAKSRVETVVCPDGQSCPDDNTCCKGNSGQYGCCPTPQAVCCPDHIHCCPYGFACGSASKQCTRGDVSVPWEIRLPAKSRVESVVCPGSQSQCPDGNTCCKLGSGQYGCCPLPQAVCCSDGVHCCPNGYTCDLAKGGCDKGGVSLPWEKKLPAQSRFP